MPEHNITINVTPSQEEVQVNVPGTLIVGPATVWGQILGTLANQLDLQAALDAKQPLDADLTIWAGLTPSANAQSLVTAANYAAMKTLLSLNLVENTALSTWAGSSNIVTLGTIATGVWSGTTIAVNKGGTGQTSYTNGQLLIGNTTGNTLDKATLTAGDLVTITNGGGSITIAAALALNDFSGLRLSNNSGDATNDIDITAGRCRDSTNAVNITAAAMTKRLDAGWAAGTNQGMRDSAAAITDTTYHIYAVSKADGTQDYYAHTSLTVATVISALQAESGGTDYLYARRIGSIVRASAAIRAFVQDGSGARRNYAVVSPLMDVDDSTLTTSRKTYTLASIPTGLRLYVRYNLAITNAAGVAVLVTALNETDSAPSTTAAPLFTAAATAGNFAGGHADTWTNTSAQIGARSTAASTTIRIAPIGWSDDLSL